MLYYVVQLINLNRMYACFIYRHHHRFSSKVKIVAKFVCYTFFLWVVLDTELFHRRLTHPSTLLSLTLKHDQHVWFLLSSPIFKRVANSCGHWYKQVVLLRIRFMDVDRPTCLSIEYYWYSSIGAWYSSIGACHQYLRPTIVVVLLYHLSFIKPHGKS